MVEPSLAVLTSICEYREIDEGDFRKPGKVEYRFAHQGSPTGIPQLLRGQHCGLIQRLGIPWQI
jgi:hypothetical protein